MSEVLPKLVMYGFAVAVANYVFWKSMT